jgi:hypothetical protein
MYELVTIIAKNHHIDAAILDEIPLHSNLIQICTITDNLLRNEVTTLVHDGTKSEPETVLQVPNILQLLRFFIARVRILPVVW